MRHLAGAVHRDADDDLAAPLALIGGNHQMPCMSHRSDQLEGDGHAALHLAVRVLSALVGPLPPAADGFGFGQSPFVGLAVGAHPLLRGVGRIVECGGVGAPVSYTHLMIFKGCSSLESVPSGLLDPFTKTTTIGSLFSGCKSRGNLPEGLFDKVGSNVDPSAKAVDASYLFENCVKMTDFPSLSKLPNVSNVASLWRGCTAMTTVPADYFPSSCTNSISVGNMFNGCTSLKSLPAGLLKNMTDITTALSMFTNCSSLETCLLYTSRCV